MFRLFIVCLMLVYSSVNYANNSTENNILILGDSLSTAYGFDAEQGWVRLLETKLAEERLYYNVINASISGETTVGGKNRIQGLLNTYQPKVVFIELGGNDGLRGFSINIIRSNIQEMIDQSLKNHASVLLAGMKIPPNYGVKYTDLFANNYQQLYEKNSVSFIPFLLEGVAGKSDLMQSDGIHPNAKAQPLVMNTVWKSLKPMLIPKP